MSGWRLLLPCAISACGFDAPILAVDGAPPVESPAIESMASSAVSVGERLAFRGGRFISPALGEVDVTLRGSFSHPGGTSEVETTMIAERIAAHQLEARFGPFTIPFTSAGNVAGVFRGRAFATNRAFDGTVEQQEESTWPEVELSVLPSIVVREFAPKLSMVESELPEARAETPYRLTIEAVGFSLASIEYQLGEGPLIDGAHVDSVIHDALGATDALGDRELLTFASAGAGYDSYVAPIVIRASSETGETRMLELNAIVH